MSNGEGFFLLPQRIDGVQVTGCQLQVCHAPDSVVDVEVPRIKPFYVRGIDHPCHVLAQLGRENGSFGPTSFFASLQ
jgi:hypothetical protein